MPLPTPKEGESKQDFMDRCMGDENMHKEFPDQEQCAAVCMTQYKNKDKEKNSDKSMKMPMPMMDESKKDFMDRCMSDPSMMKMNPDEGDCKNACMIQWDKNNKEKNSAENKKEKRKVKKSTWRKVVIDNEERGYIKLKPTELRFLEKDSGNYLEGIFVRYDSLSQDLGGWKEIIRYGSGAKTIKESDIRFLINHDENLILGRCKPNRANNTLELWEDPDGVHFRVLLPKTTYALDLKESVARGDIDNCSFAFRVVKEKWSSDGSLREVLEFQCYDGSVVTFPAYLQTEAYLRKNITQENYHEIVLRKIESKKELTEIDIKILENYIETLRSYIPNKKESEPVDKNKEDSGLKTDDNNTRSSEAATSDNSTNVEEQPVVNSTTVDASVKVDTVINNSPDQREDNHLDETKKEPSEVKTEDQSSEATRSVESSATTSSEETPNNKDDEQRKAEPIIDEKAEQERLNLEKDTLLRMRMVMLRNRKSK